MRFPFSSIGVYSTALNFFSTAYGSPGCSGLFFTSTTPFSPEPRSEGQKAQSLTRLLPGTTILNFTTGALLFPESCADDIIYLLRYNHPPDVCIEPIINSSNRDASPRSYYCCGWKL